MPTAVTNAAPSAPGRPSGTLLATAVLLGAIFISYHNSFSGEFVFDDELAIVENLTIRQLWPPWAVFTPPRGAGLTVEGRPILNLSLAIDYALGGPKVTIYHVTNLLIHAAAALALFGIVRRSLLLPRWQERFAPRADFIALCASGWWAVHPIQTEAITYVIQRAESLAGLFFLLTLYAFGRAADPARPTPRYPGKWFVASVGACALGMGTKETVVSAPLVILLYDRAFIAGSFAESWRRRRGYYLGLAGTWVLLALLIAAGGGNRSGTIGFGVGIGWWEYWLTQFPAIACYLKLAVWPHPLIFEYGVFWIRSAGEVLPTALLVTALIAGTVVALVRNRPLGFLGAWFFGLLAPTSLAPGTTQMIVEHRAYLPLAAASILGAVALDTLRGTRLPRFIGPALAAALAIGFGLLTAARNADYRTAEILWRDTVAKRPDNPLAHYMLAETLDRRGDTTGALAALRETLRLKPGFSIAHARLGDILRKLGQRGAAIEQYRAAIRVRADFVDAHANLGTTLAQEGRWQEAIEHLEIAVRLDPKFALAFYNLGNALSEAGRDLEAIPRYESALKLEPANAAAHYNLANTLAKLGRVDSAAAHYQAALQSRPDHAPTHFNYANLLAQSRRLEDAVRHYDSALQINPNYAEAHNNLGSALLELNRRDEARAQFEAALRLAPQFETARINLERLRATPERKRDRPP